MFNFDLQSALRLLAVSFVPALLGIILHEVAHGWVAKKCGDPTAASLGRLTLNPIPHIDPMGLFVFGLTSLTGSFVFGWAKPVPVNPRFFRHAKRDMMLVALAGPTTNFLLAIFFGVLLAGILMFFPYAQWQNDSVYRFIIASSQAGVIINFGLGWLNLMPVPPLDGSKVLAFFLPEDLAWKFMSLARYGFVILMLLLFTGILGKILRPLVQYSSLFLLSALGL